MLTSFLQSRPHLSDKHLCRQPGTTLRCVTAGTCLAPEPQVLIYKMEPRKRVRAAPNPQGERSLGTRPRASAGERAGKQGTMGQIDRATKWDEE